MNEKVHSEMRSKNLEKKKKKQRWLFSYDDILVLLLLYEFLILLDVISRTKEIVYALLQFVTKIISYPTSFMLINHYVE